jgi:hypothetical protein
LDGSIGLIIGNFESALGPMGGVWLVVETAVSKRTAQTLVEEEKQKSDLEGDALQQREVHVDVQPLGLKSPINIFNEAIYQWP